MSSTVCAWSFRAKKKTLRRVSGRAVAGCRCGLGSAAGSRPARAPVPASLPGDRVRGRRSSRRHDRRCLLESASRGDSRSPARPARSPAARPATRSRRRACGATRPRRSPRCTRDTLGTSFARVRRRRGRADARGRRAHRRDRRRDHEHRGERAALVQHASAGSRPRCSPGSACRSPGATGDVPGVVARRMLPPEKRSERPGRSSCPTCTSTSARRTARTRRASCASGDAGVWDGEPLELPNGRFVSKSMDNRLGAYVALEAARRVAEAGDAQVDVVARRGRAGGARLLRRAHGRLLARPRRRDRDRRHLRDRRARRRPEGGREDRPRLGRGDRARADRQHGVTDLLAAGRPRRRGSRTRSRCSTNRTHTDADAVHISRAGVPTGLVSVPLRYMHSPVELVLARRPRGGDRARASRSREPASTPETSFAARSLDAWLAASSSARCGRRSASSAAASPATRRPSSARSRSARRSSAPGSSRTSPTT